MDIKGYKQCRWCSSTLSRITWNSVFCCEACNQACTEHKAATAALTPFPIYLDQIANECLRGRPHPNQQHEQNKLLGVIQSKWTEVQALLNSRKDQILNY